MKEQWFEAIERHIPTGEVRTRFGPSPTGYMHVGNLRTAIYAWLIARRAGGKFLLRIEDTDQVRQVEGAVEIICRTLRQCGLSWDEGPDVGGPVGPYVQTARRELYLPYAELLVERGCAYRCFCEKMEPQEECGVFDRGDDPCRALSPAEVRANLHAGRPYVIRQRIPRQGRTTFHDLVFGDITVDNRTLDDQILIKRDGLPTYNFANVIDDHLMGITHVVRGSEYLSSAPKYDLLYQSFGWKIPHYVHCAPVMRDQKHKLSKRHGDPSYEDLLAMGYLSDAIVNYVALLGWAPTGEQKEREFFLLEELAEYFDIAGLSKSPAIFDLNKLNYFNACYLRALSPEDFYVGAEPYLKETVQDSQVDLRLAARLLQPRCTTWMDIAPQIDFLGALPPYPNELYRSERWRVNEKNSAELLIQIRSELEALPVWTDDALHAALSSLAVRQGVKLGTILWPLRIALSGRAVTPGGAVELCCVLGRAESLRRICQGIAQLPPAAD